MKTYILLFLSIYSLSSIAQNLSKKELSGEWLVKEVTPNTNIFKDLDNDKLNTLKNVFNNATYSFSKKGVLKIESSKNTAEVFSDFLLDGTYYYSYNNGIVSVGQEKGKSNIMRFQIVNDNKETYFNLTGVLLKVKKTKSSVKLQKPKPKAKPKVLPTRPLVFENIEDENIIRYKDVEMVPINDECIGLTSPEEARKCMSKSINTFVSRKFNVDLATKLNLSGKIRIVSNFIINKKGQIVNIVVESPHEEISNEAQRIVNLLPLMRPATTNGKPVNISFSLPISFYIQ